MVSPITVFYVKGGPWPKPFILKAPFVCRSDTHSHRFRIASSDRA